jgi:anti-sigma B factor antagonist
MELVVKECADGAVLRVEAERIDAFAAVQFRDAVRAAASGTEGKVILDLSRVRFVDSSGLGAIVSVWKTFGPDRPLELAGLQELVLRVFRLTRLDDVLTIHDTLGHDDAGQVHAG